MTANEFCHGSRVIINALKLIKEIKKVLFFSAAFLPGISRSSLLSLIENLIFKRLKKNVVNNKQAKKESHTDVRLSFLASPAGFEPTAFRLGEAPEGHF